MPFAVANHTDDVRVFAGCLTGRRDWPTVRLVEEMPVPRLADTPRARRTRGRPCRARTRSGRVFIAEWCARTRMRHFEGFNRAQAAVIEAAILVSRLRLLPRDKIEREIAYLQNAVSKTGSSIEEEAWGWLVEAIKTFYAG